MSVAALRTAIVVLTAVVLQASLMTEVRIVGISADLLLVLTVAAGLVGGSDRGAVTGFFAGLGMDLLVETPFGLSALTYLLVGYAAGAVNTLNLRAERGFSVAVAAASGPLAVLVFVLSGELVGQPLLATPGLGRVALVMAATNALLVLPVSQVVRWAQLPPRQERAVMR